MKMLTCALHGSIRPKHFQSICQILSDMEVFFKNTFSNRSAEILQTF